MNKLTINDIKSINDRKDIRRILTKMDAKNICEIGVKKGKNFQNNLLVDCVQSAVAIDIWTETSIRSQNDDNDTQQELDRQYQNMLKLSSKDSRVIVIKDYSLNACKKFVDQYFDFVYIDADHTETAVYSDLCSWWPKVKQGGILAGHDYCIATINKTNEPVEFGVIKSVDRFVSENNLILHVDNELPWHDWFLLKN